MTRPGPTGAFPLGKAINDQDQGGLFAVLRRVRNTRRMEMNFGTPLDWVATTRNEALLLARTLRQQVYAEFGDMSYDVSTLPIKVRANSAKQLVESVFPTTWEILVATPEVFLAWADRLAQTAMIIAEAEDEQEDDVHDRRDAPSQGR